MAKIIKIALLERGENTVSSEEESIGLSLSYLQTLSHFQVFLSYILVRYKSFQVRCICSDFQGLRVTWPMSLLNHLWGMKRQIHMN